MKGINSGVVKDKKSVSDILSSLLLGFSILVFLSFSIMTLRNDNNPQETYVFGYKPIRVVSGSMEPTIKVDSISIVKKASIDDVKFNDIVLYKQGENYITHRVIKKNGSQIQTKGDNNKREDAYLLTEDNIRGKVVFTMNFMAPLVRGSLALSKYIKTKEGILTLSGILTFVIGAVIFIRGKKNEKNELQDN